MRRLVISVLFLSAWASATTWHVRSTAACTFSGDGTSSSCAASGGAAGAWKGLAGIVWGSVVAGDSILLKPGDTYTDVPLNVGSSGTTGNVITISVEAGGGTATIDGANSANTIINFSGRSFITVNGLYGSAANGGSQTYGLKAVNIGADQYCGYENNGGHDLIMLHIDCSGSVETGTDDNRGGIFMSISGSVGSTEIGYMWIHGPTPGSGGSSTCGTFSNTKHKWCATGMRIFNSSGTTYTKNLLHDNRVQDLFHDGIGSNGNVSVYNNEISGIDGSGHSDSIEIQSYIYTAVYSNYIHDSGDQNIYFDCITASLTCGPARIYNNIVSSDPGFGIVLDPEGASSVVDSTVIANNTFVKTSAADIRWSTRGTVTNLVIKNNIFGKVSDASYLNVVNASTGVSYLDANAWDFNAYATTSVNYPSIAQWTSNNMTLANLQAASPARETNGKTCNVSFAGASDFHLGVSDTCAKGAASDISATYSFLATDKDGVTRSGTWDLGAYKYLSGAGSTRTINSKPGGGRTISFLPDYQYTGF